MASNKVSEWDRWLDAFFRYCGHLPAKRAVGCPRCRRRELRLVFVGSARVRMGMGFFWCDRCRYGIVLHRVGAHDNVEIITDGDDPRLKAVPKFRRINKAANSSVVDGDAL
jgi:hypothetical protein